MGNDPALSAKGGGAESGAWTTAVISGIMHMLPAESTAMSKWGFVKSAIVSGGMETFHLFAAVA